MPDAAPAGLSPNRKTETVIMHTDRGAPNQGSVLRAGSKVLPEKTVKKPRPGSWQGTEAVRECSRPRLQHVPRLWKEEHGELWGLRGRRVMWLEPRGQGGGR